MTAVELLRATGASLAAIATAAGVSRTTAARWRAGTAIPEPGHREALSRPFGIAPESWDDVAPPWTDPASYAPPRTQAAIGRLRALAEHVDDLLAGELADGVRVKVLAEARHLALALAEREPQEEASAIVNAIVEAVREVCDADTRARVLARLEAKLGSRQ